MKFVLIFLLSINLYANSLVCNSNGFVGESYVKIYLPERLSYFPIKPLEFFEIAYDYPFASGRISEESYVLKDTSYIGIIDLYIASKRNKFEIYARRSNKSYVGTLYINNSTGHFETSITCFLNW